MFEFYLNHSYTSYTVYIHLIHYIFVVVAALNTRAQLNMSQSDSINNQTVNLSEASLKSGYSDAGKKIVANIKSTMSDRAQV